MSSLYDLFRHSRSKVTVNNTEKLVDLIKARRSVRRFKPQVPDSQIIDRLIECATSAPNAHNAQPWRFYILEDRSRRMMLLQKMKERFAQDLKKDKINGNEIYRRTTNSMEAFSQAPVLILVCLDMTDMSSYSDDQRAEAERVMGIQSVASAINNLLLAAFAHGIAGCWYCAPLFCHGLIRESLSLPQSHEPQALITLGYPYTHPGKPPRKHLDEIRYRI